VPDLLIFAGPNGAGKTTFAREYLSEGEARFEFVNADEIARRLALESGNKARSDIQAGRMMLGSINKLVEAGANLAIETTLATLIYAGKIPNWRHKHRYTVSLLYLRLNSVAESIERVRRRVAAGGHNIPDEIVERRFHKSHGYFETIYKPIVNHWRVWESREGEFIPVESSERQL
jgi:predicted ABC-type ATPase